MKNLFLIMTFCFFFFVPLGFSTIINIPGDYSTIRDGMQSSLNGDTILVQPGTYVENLFFEELNITLGSLFLTTGDTSYISSTIIDGDSSGAVITFFHNIDSSTVLTGLTIMNGYAIYGGGIYCDSASPIISHNIIRNNSSISINGGLGGGIYCIDSDPLISENTITNNFAIMGSGGGISCFNSNPIIVNNIIKENHAPIAGGGIFCDYSSPTIINNNINNNTGTNLGGGICCYVLSDAIIHSNIIRENSANYLGGGIYSRFSEPLIYDNNIVENSALFYGGGVCFHYSNAEFVGNYVAENNSVNGGGIWGSMCEPLVKQNVVFNNIASEDGGGICFRDNYHPLSQKGQENDIINPIDRIGLEELDDTNPYIENNVIYGNSAAYGGGIYSLGNVINNAIYGNTASLGSGIYCNGNTIITNSIIWNNVGSQIALRWSAHPVITYCDVQGGWDGTGNISGDPRFIDPDNGDFHLMSTACGDPLDSPCIDTGDPNILDSLLDCSWGLGGLRSDMGAYGGGDSLITAIFGDNIPTPGRFALMQNYPNPFNPTTTISFSLHEPTDISLTIYNILGQKVATLFEGIKQAGMHTITWNADDFPSGIYFARLEAEDNSKNINMLLLK